MIYTQIRRPETHTRQSPQGPDVSGNAHIFQFDDSAHLQSRDREDENMSSIINYALFLR